MIKSKWYGLIRIGLRTKFIYFKNLWSFAMKKRILGLVLIFCITIFAAVVPIHAATSGSCGKNLTWILDDDGTLTISGNGTMYSYSEDLPWYSLRGFIKTVLIEDGVTRIDGFAFEGCEILTQIIVSASNENYSSEDGILFNKDKTMLICCPSGKPGICVIPNSVTSIELQAFSECDCLKSIIIGSGITSIEFKAFHGCSSLENITISESIIYIEDTAFSGCTSLMAINVSDNNKNYSSEAGVLFNKDKTTLIYYPRGKSERYLIPDSVTNIGDRAFAHCKMLKNIAIPESVTWIGRHAFSGCISLESVTIPESVIEIVEYAFKDCSNLESITIPDVVKNIGEGAFYGTAYYNNEENWENGLLYINNHLIKAKNDVTSVTIKAGTNAIACAAFKGCSNLQSITIPDSVKSIGQGVFYYCESLTNITVGSGVEGISYSAFYGCTGLKSITIPYCITVINSDAFSICNSLADVYYGGTKEDWNKIGFGNGNEALINATRHYIPSIKVTEEGGGSFTVTPNNIDAGNSIVFAAYKDGKMVDIQTKIYDGADSAFSIAVPYDTVKAMIWKNLTSMEPLCPLKEIS